MDIAGDNIDPHAADNVETVVAGKPGAEEKPAAEFKLTEDGNLVEVGGRKYVREEALHAERTRAQGYANTMKQLEPLMPEFEQFLANKQGQQRATVGRATRAAETDYSEDELNGYAITRGYYDGDNKPDVKRAQDDLDIMTAIADRRAGRAIRPVAEATTRDRARDNAQRALGTTFVDGDPIADQKYIQAVFDALPDEQKADENITGVMQILAAGLQSLDERRSGRRGGRREPVFREGGSRVSHSGGESLDALDRAAARARGKTDEQWSKMTKTIGSGASFGGTVLDEI